MTKPHKQTAIAIAVVAAILIGYFVLNKEDDSGYQSDPTGNNPDPNNPTVFNPSLAAERLYDAMKESGTDENAVMAVLQTVSVSNMKAVFGKFGKRSYNKQLGNQLNFSPFFSLPLEPLNVWFKEELSSKSYETIRIKYQSLNLF
ncbi:hypothetical protein ACI6PS_03590 [Flavobacterium sp. PLA-1-15]|uniref:hypothetical protein n=1 Tax=Flavobacterium sp. PLA-1-15 TaxID=3380533 RepID=UPI003B79AD4F